VRRARRALAAAILAAARESAGAGRPPCRRVTDPETAAMLNVLVRAQRPRRLLELGTASGYLTLWLADAAEAVGGELLSVDRDPACTARAREHLARAGLRAELRAEDPAATLRAAPDATFGFVVVDAADPGAAGHWPELLRVLGPNGLLAVDHALSHADGVVGLAERAVAETTVTTALVPVGAGVRLVVASG
jgi:predicted O-methyltransferase YrrM